MNPQLRRDQFDHLAALAGYAGAALGAASALAFGLGFVAAGAVLGAIALAVLIAGLLLWLRRSKANNQYAIPLVPTFPRWARRVAIVLALGGCVALGFAAGHEGVQAAAPSMTGSTSNYDLRVSFPSGWRDGSAGRSVLSIREPILLVPDAPRNAKMLVGLAHVTGPTLLGSRLLERLDRVPVPQRVPLGHLQAYVYTGLRPHGFRSEGTMLVAPVSTTSRTTAVVTVGCFAPHARAPAFAARCRRIAATIALKHGHALALGPSAVYAHAVSRTIETLSNARASAYAEIRAAGTPHGQADGARQARQALTAAATALRRLVPSPGDAIAHRRLVAAVDAAARAHGALARAAGRGDAGRFAYARDRVHVRVEQVRKALTALRTLGYDAPA